MKRLLLTGSLAFGAFGAPPYTAWTEHLGGIDSPQYSALTRINKSNISKLEQVWFYPAGDNGFRFGFNPTVIDGVMYLIGPHNAITALDAASGKKIWSMTWAMPKRP